MSNVFLSAAARTAAVCFVAGFVGASALQPARAEEPDPALSARSAFSSAVERLSAILQDESASPEDRRSGIAEVLDSWLDVPFITRSALGRHADAFTREQLQTVAHEMERYVVATWQQRIARAQVDRFEIIGASFDGTNGVATVETRGGSRIVTNPRNSGRPPTGRARVDYRLHERGGRWRIRTMVIDDVDVVRVFRDQFDSILQSGDPDALIQRMREVNDRLEARNPFAARRGVPAVGTVV